MLNHMSVTKNHDWLTPEEAAERVPGHPGSATIRKWARQGFFRGAVRLPSGRWQIPADAIEQMIEEGRV